MRRLGLLAVVVLLLPPALASAPAAARGGAVATEHPAAAQAGARLLRAGGNAVDAALAAAAAICVVHASSCGVGGGGFALVYEHTGRAHALDFRERAPAATTVARYLEDGVAQPTRTRRGGLAVAVPGEVAGWAALHHRFGTRSLGEILAPAIALARDGIVLRDAPHLARQIVGARDLLAADPELAAVFLDRGRVPDEAFRVRRPDLARTLEAVTERGAAAIYQGEVAHRMAATVRARGGVLAPADLASYAPLWRTPLVGTFRGRRIVTFPPPGSGGVVLTILGILADDDLHTLGRRSPATAWLLAGAMARAFADRARHYGDPAFTHVPLDELLDPARLRRLRAEIDQDAGPPARVAPPRDAGTAHVSVVDGEGNAVALTTTINTAFGAGIAVPGTGIILNNEMDDFVIQPGARNVYGLSGGAANVIAPGRRPQSSMSPTIVVAGGRPVLVVGASGGPFIVSATTQVLLDHLVFGTAPADAVAAPRLHDQGSPTPILVEPGIDDAVRARLGARGRPLRDVRALGAVSAVGLAPGAPARTGADGRKHGGTAVVP